MFAVKQLVVIELHQCEWRCEISSWDCCDNNLLSLSHDDESLSDDGDEEMWPLEQGLCVLLKLKCCGLHDSEIVRESVSSMNRETKYMERSNHIQSLRTHPGNDSRFHIYQEDFKCSVRTLVTFFSICWGKWPFLHFHYSLTEGLKQDTFVSVKSQDAQNIYKDI